MLLITGELILEKKIYSVCTLKVGLKFKMMNLFQIADKEKQFIHMFLFCLNNNVQHV